jgi:hypothetical protein
VLADVVARVLVRLSKVINSSPQFSIPIHRFLSVIETAHFTSLPSSAKIKNLCSYTSTTLHGFMVWTGTLYLYLYHKHTERLCSKFLNCAYSQTLKLCVGHVMIGCDSVHCLDPAVVFHSMLTHFIVEERQLFV